MSFSIVLDAAGLDGAPFSSASRALIERTLERDGELWCSAVNLAEVCRGRQRTSEVESFLRRGIRSGSPHGAVNIRSTDEAFAKRVGNILYASSRGSKDLADAHVVAVCADFDTAIVLTSDAEDILALAEAIPAVRVVVRKP